MDVMDARGKFGKYERSVCELFEAITEGNSSFFSALQTSQVHPYLDKRKVKSMNQFFSNVATTT